MVDCPFCGDEQEERPDEEETEEKPKCDLCWGESIFECTGGKHLGEYLEADQDDCLLTARLLLFSREREWAPNELLGQSAQWVEAYLFLLPYVFRMVDEVRERERAKDEMRHGGNKQNPRSDFGLP